MRDELLKWQGVVYDSEAKLTLAKTPIYETIVDAAGAARKLAAHVKRANGEHLSSSTYHIVCVSQNDHDRIEAALIRIEGQIRALSYGLLAISHTIAGQAEEARAAREALWNEV